MRAGTFLFILLLLSGCLEQQQTSGVEDGGSSFPLPPSQAIGFTLELPSEGRGPFSMTVRTNEAGNVRAGMAVYEEPDTMSDFREEKFFMETQDTKEMHFEELNQLREGLQIAFYAELELQAGRAAPVEVYSWSDGGWVPAPLPRQPHQVTAWQDENDPHQFWVSFLAPVSGSGQVTALGFDAVLGRNPQPYQAEAGETVLRSFTIDSDHAKGSGDQRLTFHVEPHPLIDSRVFQATASHVDP